MRARANAPAQIHSRPAGGGGAMMIITNAVQDDDGDMIIATTMIMIALARRATGQRVESAKCNISTSHQQLLRDMSQLACSATSRVKPKP